MDMRALVTGAGGLLAPYVVEALAGARVTTTSRRGGDVAVDLCDRDAVSGLVAAARPDIVIHCAGFTSVDGCEAKPCRAMSDNAEATAVLAAALPQGARLVVVSTDQVYGPGRGPHREGTEHPVNAYGWSKLAGEWAALAMHQNSCIVRTNLFGRSKTAGRASLSDVFVEAFASRRPLTLFDDVLFSPLHMSTLAALLVEIAQRPVCGTFNLGSRDGLSKAAFGMAVARHKALDAGTATIGRSTDLPSRAPRPLDLRMDVSAIEAVLGRPMPLLADEIHKL
jgi:dTDP-4-dehydrorhamnose reductase